MEPIKISIEVSLSEATLAALRQCTTAIASAVITNNISKTGDGISEEEAAGVIATTRSLAHGKVPENAPAGDTKAAAEEAPAAPAQGAQAAPEQPAAKTYTDTEMMAATKDAVARLTAAGKDPKTIRTEIFSKYGCSTSTGCPQERRAELIEELANLK